MKKLLSIFTLMSLILGSAYAQTTIDTFTPTRTGVPHLTYNYEEPGNSLTLGDIYIYESTQLNALKSVLKAGAPGAPILSATLLGNANKSSK